MSVSITVPHTPTAKSLSAIAAESVALAQAFGLPSGKSGSKKKMLNWTAVVGRAVEVKAFFGPGDLPDYPADWR
ncbi:MAG TPA: hypothetical protein ENK32_03700 [Anaerolineae bacterium]|nr:hypothetical protein [Anaerolineae bacterium]